MGESRSIRLAVVGLGYWGRNLLRAYSDTPGCEIAALVDSQKERLAQFGRHHPQAAQCPSLNDALNLGIDAVILSTPAETHHTLAREALLAGRDLFVEKPLAMRAADAEELVRLADERKRILMVGHQLLYHPAFVEAQARLRQGEFGELRYLYGRRVNLGIVRSQENALWSLAPHDIAVALWLLGSSPMTAQAIGMCYLQPGIEDVVFYTLCFSGDVIFHGHVSWLDPQKIREISIIGTEKMAVIDDAEAAEKLRIYNKSVASQRQPFSSYGQYLAIRTGEITLPHIAAAEPLRQEVAAFIAACHDRNPPVSDGRLGAEVVKVLETLTRSLKSRGEWLPLN